MRTSLKLASAMLTATLSGGSASGQAGPVSAATQPPSAWASTAPMTMERALHTATLLSDGKVLVVGGMGTAGVLASVELFDPASGTWREVAPVKAGRVNHAATLLSDGRVLIVGGFPAGGHWFGDAYQLDLLYDPATDTWQDGPSPARSYAESLRSWSTATSLDSGEVFVTGGYNWNEDSDTTSLLYPRGGGAPTLLGGIPGGRSGHQATLLPDGSVLVTGGQSFNTQVNRDVVTDRVEAFHAPTHVWFPAAPMLHPREGHTATALLDGTILAVGGGSGEPELYDPAQDKWKNAGPQGADRIFHTASLLHDGRVVVAGGKANVTATAVTTTDVYDPIKSRWEAGSELNVARTMHTATVLRDGRVLIVGGYGTDNKLLKSAEILQYAGATPPETVVEYRDTQDFGGSPGGHFFYSDDAGELAGIDAGAAGSFARTGRIFKSGGSKQLCRFYGSVSPGPNSHFYTIDDDECAALRARQVDPPPRDVQQWNYEGLRFSADAPRIDANGSSCPAETVPVYRGYNNAYSAAGVKNAWDSGHRYSTNRADIEQMVLNYGWRDEGIAFCTRP